MVFLEGVHIHLRAMEPTDVENLYLWENNIPLLLEIPFKKAIAEMYSRGQMVAESDLFFSKQLLAVAENIILQYGNSSYQR